MKRLSFSRKRLFRALALAFAAFSLWASRVQAAPLTAPPSLFNVNGTAVTANPGIYSNAYFYDPAGSYNLTVGAGTTASGYYNNGLGTSVDPFSTINVGAGTVVNQGFLGTDIALLGQNYGAVLCVGDAGDVTVTNAGTLSAQSIFGAYGLQANALASNLTVVNSGLITASVANSPYNGSSASGIYVEVNTFALDNTGTIQAAASGVNWNYATSVYVSQAARVDIQNAGLLSASSICTSNNLDASASGIYLFNTSAASAMTVRNTGTVSGYAASPHTSSGYGINVVATEPGSSLTLDNGGSILGQAVGYSQPLSGGGPTAAGVNALTIEGPVRITNTGMISGIAFTPQSLQDANATGINIAATGASGSFSIYNDGGTIQASAKSTNSGADIGSDASGISATGTVSSSIQNNGGLISSTAVSTGNQDVNVKGIEAAISSGLLTVGNTGTVRATSTGSGLDSFAKALSLGSGVASGDALVENTGLLSANATGNSFSYAYGVSGNCHGTFQLSNGAGGEISAVSTAASAIAEGVTIFGTGTASAQNQGAVTALARGTGTASDYVTAYGLEVRSGLNSTTVDNRGIVSAEGDIANANAANQVYGIAASGTDVAVTNEGTVTAALNGATAGTVVGIQANGNNAYVENTGKILVSGPGGIGIDLVAGGDLYNSGKIHAVTAIQSGGPGTLTLGGLSPIWGAIAGNGGDLSLSFAGVTPEKRQEILDYLAAHPGSGSFVLHGSTYSYSGFANVDGSGMTSFSPAWGSMGLSLENYNGADPSDSFVKLFNTVAAVPEGEIPAAVQQLSPGKVIDNLTQIAVSGHLFQTQVLGGRLDNLRLGMNGGLDSSGMNIAASGDPLLGQLQGRLYAYNPTSGQQLYAHKPGGTEELSTDNKALAKDNKELLTSSQEFNRWGVFLSGQAILADQDATSGAAHSSFDTVDVVAGADYRIDPHWTVGFLFGYAYTTAQLDDLGSRARVNGYQFGPYASYATPDWYVNGHLTGGFNDETSKRAIPLLGTAANGNPDSGQISTGIDGGYDFRDGHLTWGPIGGLLYTHLSVDSYTESGAGAASLSVASQDIDSFLTLLGMKASYDLHWKLNNSFLRPEIRAQWLHECLDDAQGITSQFNEPGVGSFVTSTASPTRDSALVGFGLTDTFPGGTLLFLNYDAQVNDTYLANSITGGVRITF